MTYVTISAVTYVIFQHLDVLHTLLVFSYIFLLAPLKENSLNVPKL